MDSQTSIRLIQAHGALHGDHYSFNSAEFVRWCQQEHLPMPSLEEANHELAPFVSGSGTRSRCGPGASISPESPFIQQGGLWAAVGAISRARPGQALRAQTVMVPGSMASRNS